MSQGVSNKDARRQTMSFLSKLGFRLNKVNNPPASLEHHSENLEDEALKLAKARRAELYLSDAKSVAKEYANLINNETLNILCENHDFLHVQWGGRKSARLINLCRNILDIEIVNNISNKEGSLIREKDKNNVLKLLFWSSLLYPMTVMWSLKVESVEETFSERFKSWMKANQLNNEEISLVLHMVFHAPNSTDENIVVNVFHDALKLEEMQFNFAHIPDIMRTDLGKNRVFAAKVKRDCQANLIPVWLMYFQEFLGETRLYPVGESADKPSEKGDDNQF